MSVLRRLRGAFGIGLTWAMVWGLAGAAAFGLIWLDLEPYQQDRLSEVGLGAALGSVVVLGGALGMGAGMAFAAMLGYSENRRTLGDLSMVRTAVLGGAAGAGLFVVAASLLGPGASLSAAGICAVVGAVSAAATLRVAQRGSLASGEAPPSLAAGDDELLQSR